MNLEGTNLAGADLSHGNLESVDIAGDDLAGADLDGTFLYGARLSRVSSGGITGTPYLDTSWKLIHGYLVGPLADLTGADLRGADLTGADLTGTTVTAADTAGATWSDTTCPDGSNSDVHVAGCFSLRIVPSVTCAHLAGTTSGSAAFRGCTPKSKTNLTGTLAASSLMLGGSISWPKSGGSTVISVTSTSPGRGSCPRRSVEYDVAGSVTGGTSAYTHLGDPVALRLCQSPTGGLKLLKGTVAGL